MLRMLTASHKNILVKHPAYAKILHQYNEKLKADGKVNNLKFYREVILQEIPDYNLQSWYKFLKRFKTDNGIIPAVASKVAVVEHGEIETEVSTTLLTNQAATASAIQRALNIGNERLKQLMDNPQLMTAKDAIDLIFKAMKAQDSRIHAVGKLREDHREQEKFDRAFDNGAYE